MFRSNSPESFKYTKQPSNRRIKSELPDFFKESHIPKPFDSKKTLQSSFETFKLPSHDTFLSKHREIILDLLRLTSPLSSSLLQKLKEIASIPDHLTDTIYHRIRTTLCFPIPKDKYEDELAESRRNVSNLQTQLIKARQSNCDLTSMLRSIDMQQRLNKDLNDSITMINSISVAKPMARPKKRMNLVHKLDFDGIMHTAQTAHEPGGLKSLCEEIRRSFVADCVLVLTTNPHNTYFYAQFNEEQIKISAKATVLASVYLTGTAISAKDGDADFDPRIQQVFKMKIKAFSAGLLMDHTGQKIGLLLITRKRSEVMFEKEFGGVVNAVAMYLERCKLVQARVKMEKRVNKIFEAVDFMLNSKILTDLLRELECRLPDIFDCERGNVLMFDYEKNNLFRKVCDGSYDNFPIFHGLSGHCISTKKPVICNEVIAERQFNKEMDDPLGENTKSILSVPLFSKVHQEIPEAVLQIINRNDGEYFTLHDQDNLVKLSRTVTNCMIVLKYSQLFANIVDLLRKLEESLDKIYSEMNTMQYEFGSVKATIIVFKNLITKHFA